MLSTRSKDLQLAVWFAEAWLHLGGYPGFAAGMRLTAALCREFWDEVYPPLEGESFELRAAPLAWAADKLLRPLEGVYVTKPATEDVVPMTWADRLRALYYDNIEKNHPKEAASAYEGGAPTYQQFLISASLTPPDWFASLAHDAAEARAAVEEVAETFAERAGIENTPSFTALLDTLDTIVAFAAQHAPQLPERLPVAGDRLPDSPGQPATGNRQPYVYDRRPRLSPPDGEAEDVEAWAPDGQAGAPVLHTRAEAFQYLREAAEFLIRTEPHSPVPYLVMRAVSWEHMPLPHLLAELLQKNDLAAVYALLGLQQDDV